MRRLAIPLLLGFISGLASSLFRPTFAQSSEAELRILTYDSLNAPEALRSVLFEAFEKRCGCKVRVQSAGDAAQILSKLELEALRGKAITQVVVGIDQTLWPQARKRSLNLKVRFPVASPVEPEPKAELWEGFVPFDWGVLALLSGEKRTQSLRWQDLLLPEFSRKLILQDPRTSTPGFAWLWGAHQSLGASSADFFKALRNQWLTLTPGWSGSYSLFLKGEAPWVWTYSTSLAYHLEKQDPVSYQVHFFKEGNPVQVEGAFAVAASLKTPEDKDRARQFLEFLVSEEVQREIPLRQWMYPARKDVKLPRSFEKVPLPHRSLRWNAQDQDFRQLVRKWEEWIRP